MVARHRDSSATPALRIKAKEQAFDEIGRLAPAAAALLAELRGEARPEQQPSPDQTPGASAFSEPQTQSLVAATEPSEVYSTIPVGDTAATASGKSSDGAQRSTSSARDDSSGGSGVFATVGGTLLSLAGGVALYVHVTDAEDQPVNQAPVITSNGGGESAPISVAENGTAVTTVAATDDDQDTLSYTIVGGADASKFAVDSSSGALSFKAAPDFETPTDANADNVYEVIVRVDDGALADTQTLAVTVTAVNDLAPVVTSDGGAETGAVSVAENQTAVTTVTATDADSATLSYSITGGADAAKFTIDATSGALSFVAAPDFDAPTDADANNVYDLIVQASDGALNDTQALAVTVTGINDAAPVITSNGGAEAAAISVEENQTAATTVTAMDADSATLSYSLAGADAALFTIDAATGVLVFATAPDFEMPVGADNVYDIIVQVSDGANGDSQAITVTVTDVEEAPAEMPPAAEPVAAAMLFEQPTTVM